MAAAQTLEVEMGVMAITEVVEEVEATLPLCYSLWRWDLV